MSIDLASDILGSYAAYGMLQVIKDTYIELLDVAVPTYNLTGSKIDIKAERVLPWTSWPSVEGTLAVKEEKWNGGILMN